MAVMQTLAPSVDRLGAALRALRQVHAREPESEDKGGDARGWRRLLEWRTDLGNGLVSAAAREEYQDFTRQLEAIPANERLKRVFDEHLWDRRRKPR
jgi:hypothetical protein